MSETEVQSMPVPTVESRSDRTAELDAFNQIVSAIRRLPEEVQLRVVKSALTFMGWADAFAKRSEQVTQHSSASVPGSVASTFSEDRNLSPKAFMLEKKPVTDVERITCLAYYLTHYKGTPHFKTLDLSKLNTDAAQIKFSNPAVAAENATGAGPLVPAGKGTKQLSALGELYVQSLPDREAAKAAIAHARPRRKNRRSSPGKNGDETESK